MNRPETIHGWDNPEASSMWLNAAAAIALSGVVYVAIKIKNSVEQRVNPRPSHNVRDRFAPTDAPDRVLPKHMAHLG